MSRFKKTKRKGFRLHDDRRKVAILTPCDDRVHAEYAFALAGMLQYTYQNFPGNLEAIAVQSFGSTILPFSREQLALWAVQSGATHTLWIDSDMRFPHDMLVRFLKMDEQIVGINAMSRREPYRNCAQIAPGVQLVTNEHSTGLEKVHRMGFGVMWIKTSIFTSMPHPWFDFNYVHDKQVWQGEDFAFFERARDLGQPFYVDHDLSKQIYHMGSFGFNPLMMNMVASKEGV